MVIILAATSKIHLVDDALLRSGRFDLKLKLELPTEKERFQLLTSFIKKVCFKSEFLENFIIF